jgi:hypothetical protein
MSSRWKKYVSLVLSQPSSDRDAILSIVDSHAPGRDNSILLEAFSNFFSKSNVAAEHQCFTLRDGTILDISREGIYILDEHRALSPSVLDSNIAIHNVVGPSNWALNFYGKFYGSLDPLNRGEENERA